MVRKAALAGATLLALLVGSLLSTGLLAPAASASQTGGITPRVIGGSIAPDGSWPSQVALLSAAEPDAFQAQFCGGTLIDPRWVLTAAHCVTVGAGFVFPARAIEVAVGINDLTEISASNRIGLESIRVIRDWDPATFEWDFALLELTTSSNQPTTPLIGPGEEVKTVGGLPARIAGWGCTLQVSKDDCGTSGGFPAKLREATVDFVSDANCTSSWGGFFDPESMICAGIYPAGGQSACFGDSGGPLTASVDGRRVLAGITSWGGPICGEENEPGVYARVLSGRDWILRTIDAEFGLEVTTGGTGQGTVTSNPAGIACGSTCSADFPYGTTVTLTAKPASGSGFTGWTGACSGTDSCTITVGAATQVGAEFRKGPTVSLKAKPAKRTSSRTAKFRFKASQSGSTFQCRLDGRSWQKCKSPKTYRNLKRGRKHTFRVKARKNGITGPVRQYSWTVKK